MSAWAMAPVFIRYMRGSYDPYSQAFIRYLFAAMILSAVCLVLYRQDFLRLLRRPGMILGLVCVNIVHQLSWTVGCYHVSATLAQLITELGVVFVIIFSFFLFHEERRVIRSPVYLSGTALSFVGAAAVLTGGGHATGATVPWAAGLLMITALCWGIYVVWAKHIVMDCHPVPMFAVLSVYITLGLAIVALLFGSPVCIFEAGSRITLIAFISGMLPLAAAHPSFHFAQKYLGSAFSSSCNLFAPLLTFVFASIFLDDAPLTLMQWAGAAVLITGTLMVVRTGQRSPESHS